MFCPYCVLSAGLVVTAVRRGVAFVCNLVGQKAMNGVALDDPRFMEALQFSNGALARGLRWERSVLDLDKISELSTPAKRAMHP